MRRISFVGLLAAGFLFAVPNLSTAGVMNSPLPNIGGGGSPRTIFVVPGIIKNNGLETVITCSSLDKNGTGVRVAVEIFDETGAGPLNDVSIGASDGVVDIPLGGGGTVATGSTVAISEGDVIVFPALTPPINIRGGTARIIANSKRIACNAYVVDEFGLPPAVAIPLSIISKKQRGD